MGGHPAVLLTGMSGVGKSTVLAQLERLGFDTVDTDDADWIHLVAGEPLWRESLVDSLLRRDRHAPLFVGGTVANQVGFYGRFDAVVLLSAPAEVVFQRIAGRTNNPFGKSPEDRARIAEDIEHVEPLLRQAATLEIDASLPLAEVVSALVAVVDSAAR